MLTLTVTLTVTPSINRCFSKFCFLPTEPMLRHMSKCLASKPWAVLQPLLHGEAVRSAIRETEHRGRQGTDTQHGVHGDDCPRVA